MAWPPRSPDLTPMDFFLWDHINILIYTSPVDSEEDLFTCIVEAAVTIRQHPFILSAHVSHCCFGFGCVSRLVAVLLNIYSKLVRNTTFFFFNKTSVMLLISNICPTHFVGPWGKAAGVWLWKPTPSSAEVKERVELFLLSPSGPSWPVLR